MVECYNCGEDVEIIAHEKTWECPLCGDIRANYKYFKEEE